jgi:ssDNA-binding Zn-finger/Zn-ribbon topoisomerase 1
MRPIRRSDEALLIEAYQLSCPEDQARARLQFRKSDHQPFFGCSNYPTCKRIINLAPYADPY